MSYSDVPEFEHMTQLQRLSEDYAMAKAAQRELVYTRKLVWLLLKQIGEPVTVDAESLLTVPDDARILEMHQPDKNGTVTLEAK